MCALVACAFSGLSALAQTTTNPYNPLPARIIGQSSKASVIPATNGNPNFLQGAEMFNPGAVAFDTASNILYVADSYNNRVLAYKNPAASAKGVTADLIIGQTDPYSTLQQGPNNQSTLRLSEGLTVPIALAVDAQGNLYVADSGNNRIIRYPQPFNQQSTVLQADLVVGQGALQSGTAANRGFELPSNVSLNLRGFHSGLALDPKTGDLWVSDPGNNRVLRFPANQLAPYTMDPTADLVLGQKDFATSKLATITDQNVNPQLVKTLLANPSGIAFDAAGRLFVSDNINRVLVYVPPFSQLAFPASRVLGVSVPVAQPINASKLGGEAQISSSPPEGVFTIGNNVYVVDTPNSRILHYDPYETWTAETKDVPSPAATFVAGQVGFSSRLPNHGSRTDASAATLSFPSGAVFSGTDVWVADSGNNRVLGFPTTGGTFAVADKLLGQTEFFQTGINHVSANGFYFSSLGNNFGGSVAVDYSSTPPRLYLSDPGNNRILGYPDARNVKADDPAAIVIGQIDFQHSSPNIPSGEPLQTSDLGLYSPAGVAVDSAGNLWVTDSGNGRVVRFPKPFEVSGQQRANLVLGQLNLFTQPQTDQTTSTQMKYPWGLAFLFDGSVLVSDPPNNRVLLFRKPANGDFRNGQAATGVYGQRDFTSSASGSTLDKLNGPRFIATDTDDRLYVADTNNARITIYRQQSTQQPSGVPATATIDNLASPIGVQVSPLSGYIWVANSNSNAALRYPKFTDYQLDPTVTPDVLRSVNPIYIALDPQDNPIITESVNRISFYYPRMNFRSAANQSDRALAPGMVADLILPQGAFVPDGSQATNTTIPWPTSLADIEVLVGGVAAPITDVQMNKIRIQVPKDVAIGQADFLVRHTSNGQVVAAATFTTDVAAPGFYIVGGAAGGAIVAKNPDGSDNGPNNAVKRGDVISLFGTGLGLVGNQPDDGAAPNGPAPAIDYIQQMVIQGVVFDLGNPRSDATKYNNVIKYFGLAPGQVGTFQLDVVVPDKAVPLQPNRVAFLYKDLQTSAGPNNSIITATIYVK